LIFDSKTWRQRQIQGKGRVLYDLALREDNDRGHASPSCFEMAHQQSTSASTAMFESRSVFSSVEDGQRGDQTQRFGRRLPAVVSGVWTFLDGRTLNCFGTIFGIHDAAVRMRTRSLNWQRKFYTTNRRQQKASAASTVPSGILETGTLSRKRT
jgi:hypothetical protein